MSADNYYVVREVDGRWYVTMGFASDPEEPLPDLDRDPNFDTQNEAMDYAFGEYSEYGVTLAPEMSEFEVRLGAWWRAVKWTMYEYVYRFQAWKAMR